MSQHCLVGYAFLCYAAVAVTCAGCAVADLIGRFKSGNRISSIVWGKPQGFFYMLNMGAGLLALFGSEALSSTQIIAEASSNLSLAIVKASGLAVATFVSLRTTISTLISSGNGQKLEIGPGRLFATLLENVERRIDQDRMVKASEEIMSIAPSLSPRAVLYVVLPYCFDQAEKDPGDRQAITNTLATIYTDNDPNIFISERSALMLSHLHKIFGLSVLEAAKKVVEKEVVGLFNQEVSANAVFSPETIGSVIPDELESSDLELDNELKKLQSN